MGVDLKKARAKARKLRESEAPASSGAVKSKAKPAAPAGKAKPKTTAKPAPKAAAKAKPKPPPAENGAAARELANLLENGLTSTPAEDAEESWRDLEEPEAERQTAVSETAETTAWGRALTAATAAPEAEAETDAGDPDFLNMIQEELYRRTFDEASRLTETGEKYIAFRLADEQYAVHITEVKEIVKYKTELTEVPRSRSYVSGILSLRGIILPVLDLRRRMGLEAAALDRNTRVLVVPDGEGLVGLIVDAVSGVVKIPESRMEPPPGTLGRVDTEFLRGVGRLDKEFYILLNLERLVEY